MADFSATYEAPDWECRVGVATHEHRADVEAVRRAAYEHSTEFAWNDLSALAWGPADEKGTVIAVWDRAGRMHSMFRVTLFSHLDQVEAYMEYSLAGIDLPLPCGVLGRAATLPGEGGQGMFALARYAYAQALINTPMQALVTQIYASGSRVESMQRKGYVMHQPTLSWDSEAKPIAPPLLAVLGRAHFAHAMEGARRDIDPEVRAHFEVDVIAADLLRQCGRL